jgi:hypothetical protein
VCSLVGEEVLTRGLLWRDMLLPDSDGRLVGARVEMTPNPVLFLAYSLAVPPSRHPAILRRVLRAWKDNSPFQMGQIHSPPIIFT